MALIKAKAKLKGDVVQVKTLMTHPMETGQRKDKQGNIIPAHHISEVTIRAGEEVLITVDYGPAVSKNPYTSISVSGPQKGDTLNVSWVDNRGATASEDVVVK